LTDRPIPFTAPGVRALLDGRKTQTRQILTEQPGELDRPFMMDDGSWHVTDSRGGHMSPLDVRWRIGDRLWVREALKARNMDLAGMLGLRKPIEGVDMTRNDVAGSYAADGAECLTRDGFDLAWLWTRPTLPLTRMPRGFSRLTLTVTDVRVQKLQGISDADIAAEGTLANTTRGGFNCAGRYVTPNSSQIEFSEDWDSTYGAGSWDTNPWVAALTFTVELHNIDEAGR
jgi:hypothetical protein